MLSTQLQIAFYPEVNQPTLAGVAVFPAPPGCFPDAQPPQYSTASLRGACPAPQSPAAPGPSPAAGPFAGPAPAAQLALDAAAPAAPPTAASPLPAVAAPAGAPAQAIAPSQNPAAGAPLASPAQAPSPSGDLSVAAHSAALQPAAPSPAPTCSAQPVYAAFCGPNGAAFNAPDGTVFQSVDAGTYLSMYDNSFSSRDVIFDQSGAVSDYMSLFQTQCQARRHDCKL